MRAWRGLFAAIAVAGVSLIAVAGTAMASVWVVQGASGSHGHARSPSGVPAPRTLTAVCQSATSNRVIVSWSAVVGTSQYTVYDSTTGSGGTYTSIATTSSLTFTATSLVAGTYWFEVSAKITGTTWPSLMSTPAGPRVIVAVTCA
jgi:hypothetical protein